MTTLFAATLALARKLGNVRSGSSTAAGNTETLVDSGRAVAMGSTYTEPDDYWNDGTIWLQGGTYTGSSRKITDYTASTGTVKFSPVLAGNSGSGTAYTLASRDWPQDKLIEFVNAGLARVGPLPAYDTSLTTVADQEEYSLPTGVYNVTKVEMACSLTSPYGYAWMPRARAEADGKLRFATGAEPNGTGYKLRITYWPQPAAISADTDTISDLLNLERLSWEAAVAAWRWHLENVRGDDAIAGTMLQEAMARAEECRVRYPIPQQTAAAVYGW